MLCCSWIASIGIHLTSAEAMGCNNRSAVVASVELWTTYPSIDEEGSYSGRSKVCVFSELVCVYLCDGLHSPRNP
jgi:hypothetical protein